MMKLGRLLLSFCLLLAAGACSCGEEEILAHRPELATNLMAGAGSEADYVVDFGELLVGDTAPRTFSLRNVGSAPLVLEPGAVPAPFAIGAPAQRTVLAPGEETELRVSFTPTAASPEPLESTLLLGTNEAKDRVYRIRLLGRGVDPRLSCEPSSLELGAVIVGSSSSGTIRCTSLAPLPFEVASIDFEGEQAASFSVPGAGLLHVEPGESVTLEVVFFADRAGVQRSTLQLLGPRGEPLASIPVEAEAVSGAEVDPGGCLDFSYVALGTTATRSVTISNTADLALRITGARLSEGAAFAVETPFPLELPARGSDATLALSFHPQQAGRQEVALELTTERDGIAGVGVIPLCAKGFGGGPTVACNPTVRDLGAVAIGLSATATFDCVNAGVAPDGVPIDRLVVRGVESDSARFQPRIRDPKPLGYALGEHFLLDVEFTPLEEGFEGATIQLETNVDREVLLVSGDARDLPPCDFSVTPPSLAFGVIPKGRSRTRDFELQNHLDSACLVRSLRVADDADSAFSVGIGGDFELDPLQVLRIPVTFAPTESTLRNSGRVLFEISNPDRRYQEISLSGGSMNPCLLFEPETLDFGTRAPSCGLEKRSLDLINACDVPLTLTAIDLAGATGEGHFQLPGELPTGLVMPPRTRTSLEVGFDPQALGSHEGGLLVEAEGGPFVALLRGRGGVELEQTDDFVQERAPKVDILWVVDNSGSMKDYQEQVANNFPAFLDFAKDLPIDFQIGVTTTALIDGVYGGFCPGGANGEENGRLFPIDGSHPRILTPSTPDLERHWRHNVQVGTCFDLNQESALEAAFRALSPPLVNHRKDPRYQSPWDDGNLGFLREDAALSVVLVSDALDYSWQSDAAYTAFFLGLKLGERERVRVHGITGPGSGAPRTCRAALGDRIMNVVRALGGSWMNLCAPVEDTLAWTEGLRNMSEGIFSIALTNSFPLRGKPADRSGDYEIGEDDLSVVVDGEELFALRPPSNARVWSYDPQLNAVRFEPRFVPKVDAEISISYEVSCEGP